MSQEAKQRRQKAAWAGAERIAWTVNMTRAIKEGHADGEALLWCAVINRALEDTTMEGARRQTGRALPVVGEQNMTTARRFFEDGHYEKVLRLIGVDPVPFRNEVRRHYPWVRFEQRRAA